MRTDTHLHVMLSPFYGRPATDPERLLADLAECGLDGGWVSSVDSMTTRDLGVQRRANDLLAEMARKYPGQIEGFCTVDPAAMEEAANEVERCVRELGLVGVKLHPWLQAFSVTHPGLDLVCEAASELRVPVLFHDGSPPYSTPRQIAWVARKHPRVRIVLGHSGLADLWRDAADAARESPNIWLQSSAAPPVTMRASWEAAGPQRVLFGSDGGFGTVRFMRYAVAKCRDGLGEAAFDQITIRNPKVLLNRAYRGQHV